MGRPANQPIKRKKQMGKKKTKTNLQGNGGRYLGIYLYQNARKNPAKRR